ncbi:hypothetical protein D3C77_740660 [compost metagenome]
MIHGDHCRSARAFCIVENQYLIYDYMANVHAIGSTNNGPDVIQLILVVDGAIRPIS